MRTILFALVVASALLIAAPTGVVATAQETGDDAEDSTICFIPEDRDCDGEIDDEFEDSTGQDNGESTTCFIPEDRNCDGEIDDEFEDNPGQDDNDAMICFLPEDRDCDGEIDDEFTGDDN